MCMQEAANREECRAFDDLKDEKAVAEAVKSGEQAILSLSLLCTSSRSYHLRFYRLRQAEQYISF